MPRQRPFKYQIDRQRNRTNREKEPEDSHSDGSNDEPQDNDKDDDEKDEKEEENDDDDDDDDEDDDEEYAESHEEDSEDDFQPTTQRKPSRLPARNSRRAARRKQSSHDSESEIDDRVLAESDGEDDDDDDDDDNEDDEQEEKAQEHRTARKNKRSHLRSASITMWSSKKKSSTSSDEESSTSEPEWPEEKDDSDDEDFVPSSKARSKRKLVASSSEEEEDFIVDDDAPVKSRRPNNTRTSRLPSKRRRRGRVPDSDEMSDEDNDDVLVRKNQSSQGRRYATNRTRRKTRSTYDDNEEDHEDALPPARTTRSRLSSNLRPKSYKEVDSDIDDDEDNSENHSSKSESPPPRFAASRVVSKVNESIDTLQGDHPENHSRKRQRKTSPSKEESSDDEFLADSASEDSDEKEVFYTDSEDDGDVNISPAFKGRKSVNIDNDEIGSAGDSDDDDYAPVDSIPNNNHDFQSRKPDPRRAIEPVRHKRNYSVDESSDDEGSKLFDIPPKLPTCPSSEDAITLEPLPKIHVCYISPDGQSRQCFSIKTLRQIALNSDHLPLRVDLDGSKKGTFLQPPHFRTAMSDDLLDQIASRFGREALNLHGDFYNRKPQDLLRTSLVDDDEDDDYADIFGVEVQQFGEEFVDHVQRYMNKQMGSRDIYACPLCYSEMHRRIVKMDVKKPNRPRNNVGHDDKTDDEEFLQLPPDSNYDPMTVLGWLDNDRFEASSCFCFAKVVDLKQHLLEDHAVETKGIQGNDLYHRFRVRGQDGLLQRYLHNQWKRLNTTTFQGAMQQYWFQGNNQSFVFLVEMMKRAEVFMDILKTGDAHEADLQEAEDYLKVGRSFFESFQDRALLEWEQISSPFAKNSQRDDLRDFLAEDDGEDLDQNESPPFLAHRQLQQDDDSDPNNLVNRLKRKYAGPNQFQSDDDVDGSDSADNQDEGDLVVIDSNFNPNGYYSEEEEEEDKDEWVRSIRSKRRVKPSSAEKKSNDVAQSKGITPHARKLTRRKPTTPLTTSAIVSQPTSASKRRSIAAESSSDDGGSMV